MTVDIYPPEIAGVGNPVYIRLISDYPLEVAEVNLNVNGKTYNFKREFFGGKTVFRISDILKRSFLDSKDILDSRAYIDKMLSNTYTYSIPGNGIMTCIAVRAVRQMKGQFDMDRLVGAFLTQKIRESYPTIRKYVGYPMSLSFLTSTGAGTTLTYAGSSSTYTQQHVTVDLNDTSKDIFIKTQSNNTTDEINIEILPEPCSPFYVRWLNGIGGWHYYMFKFRQQIEVSISNVKIFESMPIEITEIGSVDGAEVIDAEFEVVTTAGTDNISIDEWGYISSILSSPVIQIYNKDVTAGNVWSRVYVNKGKTLLDTRESMQSIEFDFIMPKPITLL